MKPCSLPTHTSLLRTCVRTEGGVVQIWNVYAPSSSSRGRAEIWGLIGDSDHKGNFIISGDFNMTTTSHDRWPSAQGNTMCGEELERWTSLCWKHSLVEITHPQGFTWNNNKRGPERREAMIDRFYLKDQNWGFLEVSSFYSLEGSISDHKLVGVRWDTHIGTSNKSKPLFKLNVSLLKDPMVHKVITKFWEFGEREYLEPFERWSQSISMIADFLSFWGKRKSKERRCVESRVRGILELFHNNPPENEEQQVKHSKDVADLDAILDYRREGLAVRAKLGWTLKRDMPSRYLFSKIKRLGIQD